MKTINIPKLVPFNGSIYTNIYIFIEILVSKFQLSNYTEKKNKTNKNIYIIFHNQNSMIA